MVPLHEINNYSCLAASDNTLASNQMDRGYIKVKFYWTVSRIWIFDELKMRKTRIWGFSISQLEIETQKNFFFKISFFSAILRHVLQNTILQL